MGLLPWTFGAAVAAVKNWYRDHGSLPWTYRLSHDRLEVAALGPLVAGGEILGVVFLLRYRQVEILAPVAIVELGEGVEAELDALCCVLGSGHAGEASPSVLPRLAATLRASWNDAPIEPVDPPLDRVHAVRGSAIAYGGLLPLALTLRSGRRTTHSSPAASTTAIRWSTPRTSTPPCVASGPPFRADGRMNAAYRVPRESISWAWGGSSAGGSGVLRR
jgi:hypothetical protein